MPVVELSFTRLQKLVGKVTKRQISDALPFLGLDIESEDKNLIRVEYSPNRPDYSTDFGIALGLQGLLQIKTGAPKLHLKKSKYSIKSKAPKIRPFVTGVVAKNKRIDDKTIKQLMALQEDLHFGIGRKRRKSSMGIHDLDEISFPLLYKTVDRNYEFIPLNHDKKLSIHEILKTGVGQDYGHILGDSDMVPILLDAKYNTVSFPPIINAAATTVTTRTRNLFVEVTGINKDDARDMLAVAATILSSAGFTLESVQISGASAKLEERKIPVSPILINQILGLNLSNSKIVSSLKKSRLDAAVRGKNIICTIPAYRFDILGPMDLVEETALGYGIENLQPILSPSQTLGEKHQNSIHLESIASTMTGLGYMEALNSSLTSRQILYDNTNRDPSELISVLDSKSLEHTILRDSLFPGLINTLAKNIHEPYPQKLFEIGTVFGRSNSIAEETHLCAITSHKNANFTEMKSVLQSVIESVFGKTCETRNSTHMTFEKGHVADIIVGQKNIGVIGEITKHVKDNFKLREPIVSFEIKLPD